jgi:cell wall-associated NlpC family hydrolase
MKWLSRNGFVIMLILVVCLTGCNMSSDKEGHGNNNQGQSDVQPLRSLDTNQGGNLLQSNGDAVIPILNHEGGEYIPLRQLAETLEFQYDWNPTTERVRIGDNDVAYEIPTGSTQAIKEDEPIHLQSPPISLQGNTYITKDAVEALFGDIMSHIWTTNELRIQPSEEMSTEEAERLPDFQDDPNDPYKDDADTSFIPTTVSAGFGDVALTNANPNKLLNTAKKYIGVKYEFGAGPYPQTNRFDCSTYTKFVYGKHNVKLSRLSRNQAKEGISVSKNNLHKGDLMFFYLPGRYKSNKIVGHVGIYMGNGKMIHASTKPKNGVQITSINKAFWKKTYLKSRRVIS